MRIEEYLEELNKIDEIEKESKRFKKTGINWNWYYAPTREDAIEYFKELTGATPYDSTIIKDKDMYAFRLRADFKKRSIDEDIKEDEENIAFTKYDDEIKYAYSKWSVVKSKTVEDDDGEETKLVWYFREGDPLHVFMLGDPEQVEPSEENSIFTTTLIKEARKFFDNYDEYYSEDTELE